MDIEPLKVDVEQVLTDKNPGLAKKLPQFIINYLKRIIHQEEMNDFLSVHGDKIGIDFTQAAMQFLDLKIKVKNFENVPEKGRFTFAANHPIGGLDGIALLNTLSGQFDDIKIMANDILMNIKNLHPFFLPINKHGGQAKDFIEVIHKTYESDAQIAVFPAGLISRRSNGKIRDTEWKATFIKKTVQYKRDVIPVHISGRVSNFFYNLANIRKLLNIKSNIEMLYLPNEMFKFRGSELTITFGKPISYNNFTKDRKPAYWSNFVKEKVYELANI